jgi:tartronate-semialdehyde synthase
VAGGGIINADASDLLVEFAELTGVPVIPTLMGWGTIPDDHPLMAGMCGLQTSHRYGNATMLASDFVLGIGNRWANRHTGSTEVYCKGRTFVHVDIEPTQIGRVFNARLRHRQRRQGRAGALRARGARAQGRAAAARLVGDWAAAAPSASADAPQDHFTETCR